MHQEVPAGKRTCLALVREWTAGARRWSPLYPVVVIVDAATDIEGEARRAIKDRLEAWLTRIEILKVVHV